jgi:hypothetical protein
MGQDWSLASNRALAYIVIVDLYRMLADIYSSLGPTYTGQNADICDDIHEVIVTKMRESLQNHQQGLHHVYMVSMQYSEINSREALTSHPAQVTASSISVKISATVVLLASDLPGTANAAPTRFAKVSHRERIIVKINAQVRENDRLLPA